jgi:hypothetical protein
MLVVQKLGLAAGILVLKGFVGGVVGVAEAEAGVGEALAVGDLAQRHVKEVCVEPVELDKQLGPLKAKALPPVAMLRKARAPLWVTHDGGEDRRRRRRRRRSAAILLTHKELLLLLLVLLLLRLLLLLEHERTKKGLPIALKDLSCRAGLRRRGAHH